MGAESIESIGGTINSQPITLPGWRDTIKAAVMAKGIGIRLKRGFPRWFSEMIAIRHVATHNDQAMKAGSRDFLRILLPVPSQPKREMFGMQRIIGC